jgi:hypothetical protein
MKCILTTAALLLLMGSIPAYAGSL